MTKAGASPRTPTEGAVPGAGGIVFNARGEVLLLRHRSGSWVFAKGHIDPGESALEAAIREVEEESGIQAHCPDPSFQKTTRYVNDRREARLITWFPLLAEDDTITPEETVFIDAGFFHPDEATGRLSFNEDRELLGAMLEWWQSRPEGPLG